MSNSPFPVGSSVVAYLRDSGHEEQENSTLQQETAIRTWCARHQLDLTMVFKDEARQGSSVARRAAFIDMIDHFHKAGCREKGIIVWSMDRLSRNVNDAQYYKADLRRLGYLIHSMTDNIPEGPYAAVFEAIIDSGSHAYLEKMSVNISRGLDQLVANFGAVPGHPPPGFKRQPIVIGKHRDGSDHVAAKWIIDEAAAPAVIDAWQMRAEGYAIRDIHGKHHLVKNRSSYAYMFRNRLYIGILDYAGVEYPGYCPPLIPQSVWDRVQKLNARHSLQDSPLRRPADPDHPRRAGSSFLLSGLVYCSRCSAVLSGRTYHGRKDARHAYYACSTRHDRMSCDAPHLPRTDLDNIVLETIAAYLEDPANQQTFADGFRSSMEDFVVSEQAKTATLRKSLDDTRRRIDNLTNRIAEDPAAPASVLEMIKKLEAQERASRLELDRLVSLQDANVRAQTTPDLAVLAGRLNQAIQSEDLADRRVLVRLLVDRIVVDREDQTIRGVIYLKAPPDVKKNNIGLQANSHQGHHLVGIIPIFFSVKIIKNDRKDHALSTAR